jgi:transcriptional regulator with XRE-family HTH domain
VGTRLSANLNRESPTISLPFSVFGDTTFAQRLKRLRLECGLTQKQLSLKAGLAKDLVWRWERELWGARRRSVERVAAVLQVEPEYLTKGRDSLTKRSA